MAGLNRRASRQAWTQALEAKQGCGNSTYVPAVRKTTRQPPRSFRPPTPPPSLTGLLDRIKSVAAADNTIPNRQVFDVTPVPKPRMTHADRWLKRDPVVRYRAYCDELRLRGAQLPSRYSLIFVLPMPASWPSQWKSEMDGQPHLQRPDSSNLAKAVEDALVPKDETLHVARVAKSWGYTGRVIIEKLQGSA